MTTADTQHRLVLSIRPVVADDGSTALFLLGDEAWQTRPTDTPPNTPVRGLLANAGSLQLEIFRDRGVAGLVAGNYGAVVLDNRGRELDAWVNYGLAGAEVWLHWGPADAAYPVGYTAVWRAYCAGWDGDDNITLKLRDQTQLLQAPVVTDGFDGSGGAEGTGSVPKRKQFVAGDPGFFEPILVDRNRQIYYACSTSTGGLHDLWKGQRSAEVSPFDVYIGAVKVARAEANYTSRAELEANAPALGEVKWYFGPDCALAPGWKDGGCWFRLTGSVVGPVRVYATGYPNDGDHARIGSVLGSFFAAHFALRAGVALADVNLARNDLAVQSVLVNDERSYLDVLNDQAQALSGWFGFDRLGRFRSGYLLDPASTSAYYGCTPGLLSVEPAADSTSVHTFDLGEEVQVLRQAPGSMAVPVRAVSGTAGECWPCEIANGASAEMRDALTRQVWSSFSGQAAGTALRDPGSLPASVTIRARLLQNPFSQRLWVERYLALYAGRRHYWTFRLQMTPELLQRDLHECVTLRHPRWGLAGGVKCRIVAITIDCTGRTPEMQFTLWSGTPGRYTGGSTSTLPGAGGGGGGSGPAFVPPTIAQHALGDFSGVMAGHFSMSAEAAPAGLSAASLGDFSGVMVGHFVEPPIGAGGYAYSVSVNDPVAVPAHGAGALLVMLARNNAGTSPPSTASGWTSVAAVTPSFGYGYRVMWRVDVDGSITSISPNAFGASQLGVHVYTGASAVGAVALQPEDVGSTATVPALTLDATDGTSWVMCVLDANQARTASDPAGLTARLDSGGLPPTQKTWDTAGGVSGWSDETSTWSGGAMYWSAVSLEIKA